MRAASIPAKFPIPFAANAGPGFIRAIPQASQIGIVAGAASLNDGFPPQTFQPLGSGGLPPSGQDVQGILNQITQWNQWQNAGGLVVYDPVFATEIGGYPQGAVLASTTPGFLWLNTVDNNATNPDGASPSGWVAIVTTAGVALYIRTRLLQNTTFYVATTGSDSNAGTQTAPFLTLQRAWNVISDLDLNGYQATVSIANGTYAPFTAPGFITGQVSPVLFIGNVASPQSVVITGTGSCILGTFGSWLTIQGVSLSSNGTGANAGNGISALSNATVTYTSPVIFNTCSVSHTFVQNGSCGATPGDTGTNTIAGGAQAFCFNDHGFFSFQTASYTLTGTPAFTIGFVECTDGGCIINSQNNVTFSGSATGPRYNVINNATVNTAGRGANVFPGSTAGTTASGGVYA